MKKRYETNPCGSVTGTTRVYHAQEVMPVEETGMLVDAGRYGRHELFAVAPHDGGTPRPQETPPETRLARPIGVQSDRAIDSLCPDTGARP